MRRRDSILASDAAASPAMRRRVNGSYAKACIDASKNASALCSAGMIAGRNEAQRCRESDSAMIDVRDDLDELEQSRAERAQRAQPGCALPKLARLHASSRILLACFPRITPQSQFLDVSLKASMGLCAANLRLRAGIFAIACNIAYVLL